MTLYRGTLIYDEPLRVRCDAGTGKRNDQEYNRLRHLAWRQKNADHVRKWRREYQRDYRRKRLAEGVAPHLVWGDDEPKGLR